ncbi:hypothetical protein SS1G_02165 [Sclerotinia sclerotiorum 1980 UF-70]|uniref:Cytomegalovirus gH-receptor family protein n=2 Tax=Sclerotinia sclerotiorum (strain ATCC 18683 / 1980 / Ss-1) TaxID=665079 RepID=A7EA34_SCLS1|nr:hypothetical protein SS1G_02165 [Sclerotinia sclerotiorum 1980 UF-70]APA08472.1 hypothetical protein sscle_04g032420 [Sclerotinia sclerotiorum 1980 UF-70]EDN99312.1 hypothetical protein SS1G_02165 [Sclerotinia sclerotiorum 1980 UF-70]
MAVENVIYSHKAGPRVGNHEQDARSPEQDNLKQLTAQPAIKHLKSFPAMENSGQLRTPSPSPSPRGSSPSQVAVDESLSGNVEKAPSVQTGNQISESFHQFGNLPSLAENYGTGGTTPPPPIPKDSPSSHELDDIPEEVKSHRKLSLKDAGEEKVLKLSAAEMTELTSAPESLPIISPKKILTPNINQGGAQGRGRKRSGSDVPRMDLDDQPPESTDPRKFDTPESVRFTSDINGDGRQYPEETPTSAGTKRPTISSSSRAFSAQPATSQWPSYSKPNAVPISPKRRPFPIGRGTEPLNLNLEGLKSPVMANGASKSSQLPDIPPPSPIPQSIPLPPMSIPTYLQLELSATRPSPLYIYRSASTEFPYESSKVKFERLLNFLLLPPQLEQVLYFGSLACLDAWLYTFTILPLRFFKALGILISWWGHVLAKECRFITGFVYHGTSRMWQRRNERRNAESLSPTRSMSRPSRPSMSATTSYQSQAGRPTEAFRRSGTTETTPRLNGERRSRQGWGRRHRRMKSQPSSLSSYNKADLLQGAVIIFSSFFLMKLDASRMYHSIRAQSAIRLYVIYNLLEVFDRLASALGQDIFECLFSDETLERDSDGRSKVLRPLGMFVLALIYNVVHAAALFTQVVTLNVAVNSYSNALITLLLSNQFVEVKGTVFKKFEKDNLFQLTCADVVERFQLWLMLMIIALRNIVEMGGFSSMASSASEATSPLRTSSMLPNSFTILPGWSGEVFSPFFIVIGSEMLVDWIKHAYISKFNGVKPAIYQRFLDVLAKDYYTNAFVNQNLLKRLGLPVIPLSCLFIRAAFQTYHMFLATHLPPPLPSATTSLSVESSPATTAAFEHFDTIVRKALGRSTFGLPNPDSITPWYLPSTDDVIASLTMIVFFLGAFFVLLACKLVLGMLLLKFARNRYQTMKMREHGSYETGGKRVGGWGMIELNDDKKRWIYDDDPETLKKLKEKERSARDKEKVGAVHDFSKISRYEMAAKRIW